MARNLIEWLILVIGLLDDFVIDICNVHNLAHIVSEVILHNASYDVKADIVTSVSHVRFIVDSWATLVPRHLILVNWLKYILHTQQLNVK